MRRCRTKKNKKWWVQLIPQRPHPALGGTWCILWRFWTQSLTHGPSVSVPLSCGSLPFVTFPLVSSIRAAIACSMTSILCFLFLRGKLVGSRGERGLNKKEHDTKVHSSPLFCFPLSTCEHSQVTSATASACDSCHFLLLSLYSHHWVDHRSLCDGVILWRLDSFIHVCGSRLHICEDDR